MQRDLCDEPGDCSLQGAVAAQVYRRGEQQLPEFRGGSEAVTLVLCFVLCYCFLLVEQLSPGGKRVGVAHVLLLSDAW